MARTDNLSNFLTDVADAIREKKGSQEEILASDFDTEITNLPSQGVYQTKSVTVTENGTQIITPDQDYDALDQLNLTVRVEGTSATLDITNDAIYVDDGTLTMNEFTELEYIESTGTQYIQTDYLPNQNTKLVAVISGWIGDGYKAIMAGNTSWDANNLLWNAYNGSARMAIWYNNRAFTWDVATPQNEHTYEIYRGSVVVDGSVISNNTTINNNVSFDYLRIWKGYTSHKHNQPSVFKLHSLKVYEQTELVRDFIPVKDTNDVVCLYDKITEQFFYNMGTGDFIAGPEI